MCRVLMSLKVHRSVTCIPFVLKCKAVEQLLMSDRALEEQQRVMSDIECSVNFFVNLHSAFRETAAGEEDPGRRAVILVRLWELAPVMRSVWSIAGQYFVNIPDMPDFFVQEVIEEVQENEEYDDQTNNLSDISLDYDSEPEDN